MKTRKFSAFILRFKHNNHELIESFTAANIKRAKVQLFTEYPHATGIKNVTFKHL